MIDVEFVAFDLETTGLSPAFCQIVEFGAVRFRADGAELDRMQCLVDPGCRVPAAATAIHGISDDMLCGQRSTEQVLPEFLQFLGDSTTILLAHNASFDVGFLSFALTRQQLGIPPHSVVDTMVLSRRRLRQIANHRLDTVAKHFGVADFTEHRALADALVLRSIFLRLLSERPAIRKLDDLMTIAPPLNFETANVAPIILPAGFEPLAVAIETGQSVGIVYDGGTKGETRRMITPREVIETNGLLYLIAHCHIDQMEKHFRLDRIQAIR